MKCKSMQLLLIILFIFLLESCDPSGNLFLTNGYEYGVEVHASYTYNDTIIERIDVFYPGIAYAVAARRKEYNNIVAMRIEETLEGAVLAEYPPEYLELLRKAYKNKERQESWVFTEKGLFLKTIEISRCYNFDSEKIMEYYRSDEAVEDLNRLLESTIE